MKKQILGIFIASMFTFLSVNVSYGANVIKVMKDNQFLQLSANPIQKNGRVLVPLSDIAKSMGINTEWDANTKTVKFISPNNANVAIQIGSNDVKITKDNEVTTKQIDVAPIIYNNKVYVPVRFIAECFNTKVEWDGWYQVVYLGDCKKLGYYDEFPDVPSFARIENGTFNTIDGMPSQMIYKHTVTKMKSDKALEMYLKIIKNAGFIVNKNDMNYSECSECDDSGNCKVISRTLEGFTGINEEKHLKINVKADVLASSSIDYKERTKTIYFGPSLIVIRIIDLKPKKLEEYYDVKTIPYNQVDNYMLKR